MAHHTAARIAAGAALTVLIGLVSMPTAQAAERPSGGTGPLAGPLGLDNLLSLGFLAPTVRDAKQQVTGLVSGLSPAKADSAGLGSLLK
uniref:Secreted protein n=1 Tax=Streptomyces sp. NBC_00049 TaxID=2903617 RepID=A0AAU2JSL4_9ACTN